MLIASCLLLAMAVLGGADILLFHTLAHGIRRHLDSRTELLSHALRGPTYLTLFLAVPNLALDGAWFVALLAVLAFDLAISLWDFAVERASRARLGGMTSGEYVLHILLGILYGALVTSLLLTERHRLDAPTRIAWEPIDGPWALRAILAVSGVLAFGSGVLDLLAVRRLGDARRP
ncbi:MAG: hypothetical protein NTV21_07545 [Planctomycetota bacterium]|nr:hypothetical protein [Planctomycetota bacterium]